MQHPTNKLRNAKLNVHRRKRLAVRSSQQAHWQSSRYSQAGPTGGWPCLQADVPRGARRLSRTRKHEADEAV